MPTLAAIELAKLREQHRANVENEQREKFKAVTSAVNPFKFKINDPYHYNKESDMVKATANLSFDMPFTGKIIDTDHTITNAITVVPFTFSLGNSYEDTSSGFQVGYGGSRSTATRIARKLDSSIRGANAGSSNYGPNLPMLYVMSFDSILTNLAALIRLYKSIDTFNTKNWLVGRAVLAAYGFVEETAVRDLVKYKKEFKKLLLNLWEKLKMFNIPAPFDVVQKHIWNATVILGEDFNEHSQLFMYMPIHVMKYRMATETVPAGLTAMLNEVYQYGTLGAGGNGEKHLKPLVRSNPLDTINNWFSTLYDALDALMNDPAITLLSGDILKRSTNKDLPAFPLLDTTQPLEIDGNYDIIYHDDIASFQFDNIESRRYAQNDLAIPNSVVAGVDYYSIYENDTETLVQGLMFDSGAFIPAEDIAISSTKSDEKARSEEERKVAAEVSAIKALSHDDLTQMIKSGSIKSTTSQISAWVNHCKGFKYLRCDWDNPTTDDVLELTRGKSRIRLTVFTTGGNTYYASTYVNSGTEIYFSPIVYYYNEKIDVSLTAQPWLWFVFNEFNHQLVTPATVTITQVDRLLFGLPAQRVFPLMDIYGLGSEAGIADVSYILLGIVNYNADLPDGILTNVHYTAVVSEYSLESRSSKVDFKDRIGGGNSKGRRGKNKGKFKPETEDKK